MKSVITVNMLLYGTTTAEGPSGEARKEVSV
jgi:hypothetical protein